MVVTANAKDGGMQKKNAAAIRSKRVLIGPFLVFRFLVAVSGPRECTRCTTEASPA